MRSKSKQDSNAVVYAVRQVCGLFGVELLRMQSRVFTVPGAGGRDRPMFVGSWTDMNGTVHHHGMTDLLARPRVEARKLIPEILGEAVSDVARVTIPLWIEVKSGKDRLSPEQEAFRHYVQSNGENWLSVHDDVRPLMEWFEKMGVRK